MGYDKSRIGIAYVSGAQERKINKKKYKNEESSMSCCTLQYGNYLLQMGYKKKQKYIHSEIIFCYNDNCSYADSYGVYENTGVTRGDREFSNKAYKFLFFSVSELEFDTIFAFCTKQLKKKFDYAAASWRLLIYPPKSDNLRWWCASFVHAALKTLNLLKDYRLNTLDNDDLVDLIRHSKEFTSRVCSGLNPGDYRHIRV